MQLRLLWPRPVRISTDGTELPLESSNDYNMEYKERVGRARFELAAPAMSRRYPNQARPPALCIMKKFVAQIYVVDRSCLGINPRS
jgi:hypothetical protein